ncbi:hypothetical protein QA584_22840 [Anaerocolumna sp. AGMB13025]|uniref:hypothetical protein n=1 Tax=Anaerocolumna sp. AGMB13025 TaxID=3039116 RepID=UPI00241F6E70|nr:hypothetical protein [Anaerocolumna sp. AGMB13025]WFR56422.1 hypothetical protein QA584_22840 [Anaerocolumna sp. AGMB13025]
MKKPVLNIESDGKWSKITLFGKDISEYTEHAELKIEPGNVTLSLKLSGLDRVTPGIED